MGVLATCIPHLVVLIYRCLLSDYTVTPVPYLTDYDENKMSETVVSEYASEKMMVFCVRGGKFLTGSGTLPHWKGARSR